MRRGLLLLALLAIAEAIAPNLPSPIVARIIAEVNPTVRMIVAPKIGTSPQDVHVKVFVDRTPANRKLIVNIDGPNYGRKTFWDLEGELAPRVFDVWRQSLPCGNYEVTATVVRNDNTQVVARETFRLLGFNCPSDPDDGP